MTNYDAMHQRCREILARLDVRPPVPLRMLVQAVARAHGRPITLVPADLPVDAPFGATGTDDSGEVVVYQRNTTASHQLVIVLHELAHILAQHPRKTIQPSVADVREDLNMLPEAMLHLVLGTGPAGATAVSDELQQARPGLLDELRASAEGSSSEALSVHPEQVAGASLYDDIAEWEAETMGTIMLSWLTDRSVYPVSPTDARLRLTLGDI
ncbi:hypothetical protein [Saccharopolyspora phatthalungensis]|uniref:IrrE N-terminal-like domain-containing protein n=1 Tax=Saccharopolyspora phatthalungensis TaxID=664693 RepID=A0A840QCC2_9PSEU|nr:hypothetical protein [Saccharopolyspora phatthalungensis]MBB5157481.1 hypothetical protein [Saccharopolyspora phatthalungensis]